MAAPALAQSLPSDAGRAAAQTRIPQPVRAGRAAPDCTTRAPAAAAGAVGSVGHAIQQWEARVATSTSSPSASQVQLQLHEDMKHAAATAGASAGADVSGWAQVHARNQAQQGRYPYYAPSLPPAVHDGAGHAALVGSDSGANAYLSAYPSANQPPADGPAAAAARPPSPTRATSPHRGPRRGPLTHVTNLV